MKTPAARALSAAPVLALGTVLMIGAAQTLMPSNAEAAPTIAEKEIKWKGCGISKKAFLSACAEAYEAETGVKVKVSGGGATKGIAAAGDGSADFGGTCRGCLESMDEDEMNLTLSIVAWDALVPIVFPKNPVQNLTKDQVVGILNGSITDWSEVGGAKGEIEVYVRTGKTSGVGYSVRKMIFGDADANFRADATEYKSSGPLEQQVEVNPNAFGITGISSAKHRKVKTLSVDGFSPEPKHIASGKYPYYRPLYLAYKNLGADQQAFLDWIQSDAGQAVITSQGTVNIEEGWRLPVSFGHWTEVENIENLAALQAEAKKRLAEAK